MNFIIPLIYILFSTGTVVYFLKEKFGKCLPISMIITTLLLFISQVVFNTFLIGYILCIIFSLICPIIIVYKKIRNEDTTVFKKNYLSYGLITFVILYIILYILNIGKLLSMSDEYHYWGYNVKYMIEYNTYNKNGSHLPFISTFEMFMCYLWRGYSESAVTFAIQLFEFGFIIPCVSEFQFKDKKYNTILKTILGVIFGILLVLMFDFEHTASTIYTDAFMMLYLAYLIFQTTVYDQNKKSNIIILCISICGFVLNKQIVLALLLIPLFNLFVRNILENQKIKNKLNKKNILNMFKMIAIYLVVPLLLLKLWNIYISDTGSSTGSSVGFLTNFMNILTGKQPVTYELTALENYLKAITNRSIFVSNIISLTYISLFCIIILAIYSINKIDKKFDNKKMISLILSYIAGAIGYALIFLIMYSFGGFDEVEGLRLASYERYLSTFLMGLIIALFMIYVYLNSNKKTITYKTILLSLCIMFVFLPGDKYYCLLPGFLRNSSSEKAIIEKAQRVSKSINDYMQDEKANILVLTERLEGNIHIKYYAEKFDYKINAFVYDDETTLEDLKQTILDYDYIITLECNEKIKSYLETLIDEEVKEEIIYKVDSESLTLSNIIK